MAKPKTSPAITDIAKYNLGLGPVSYTHLTMQNPKAFNAEGYEFKQGTVNLQTADQVQAYMTQIDDTDLDASITRIQNVSMELYGNCLLYTSSLER